MTIYTITSFPNLIAYDEVYAVRASHTWGACYLPVHVV
jgi:hypothetical protein